MKYALSVREALIFLDFYLSSTVTDNLLYDDSSLAFTSHTYLINFCMAKFLLMALFRNSEKSSFSCAPKFGH